ncbi:hypothetical protein FM037_21985 [Shewanella psychropiezotolerans]|uniref:Uncharacterized protein n=1 Tax=Shewanella psychropiezotolerans TaxID=2593655 RepID=A0ABX5X853_9GAMM|nr:MULTISPECIES: hypothetical protein [Shewanella]MPY23343.1 hypothetical protein [Shewanella sp. YLB-07]QDO85431.1 hypothetical protein FM037_21985 [Shewanella psychropiezotolerans]
MNKQSIIFIPRYEISEEMKLIINGLAGQYFNNQVISIEMGAVQYRSSRQQDFIQLSLSHLGVEAEVYVPLAEAERLLGLKIKHLDHDYLSYVITQALGQYGVELKQHLDMNKQDQPLLIACQILMGGISVAAFLKMETLEIDFDSLQARSTLLPQTLALTSTITPFETMLSLDEIRGLSADELVLVFPK